MKRIAIAILSLSIYLSVCGVAAVSGAVKSRPQSVVYVDGQRYYLHTIATGDTLYSLSRLYGVTTVDIMTANPIVRNGFNVGLNLKIPYVEESVKPISEKKLRKNFDTHTVSRGETLYSISRRYSISVEMIMEDNRSLDPTNISIGEQIYIRKSEQGLTGESETLSELDDYREQLNKVLADRGLAYYLVKDGDTIESLMERFDLREGEIEDLNDLHEGEPIAVGSFILVNEMGEEQKVWEEESYSSNFTPLGFDERLDIALLLPLSIRGYAMTPFVEFYQGFLLGMEDLKVQGRNIELNLFNTERDQSVVEQIVTRPEYLSSELVVGPIYEELFSSVLRDAEARGIPVVSPLVSLSESVGDSDVLFQMAPAPERRYDKLREMLSRCNEAGDEEYRIALIYGESNDMEYAEQIEMILEECGRSYHRHNYKYEHPSIITEREKLAEQRYKQAEEEASMMGLSGLDSMALDTLRLAPSPSDLTYIVSGELFDIDSLRIVPFVEERIVDVDTLRQDSVEVEIIPIKRSKPKSLLFVMSDRETEVDRILSALASAYTSKAATLRGSGRRASEEFNYSVVANPDWQGYNNIDRTLYFRDRVINFPSYVAGRDSELVRVFDSRYSEAFGEFPSRYAYRGYDVAKIFGEGMYRDIEYGMQGRVYTPLQSEYRFEQSEGVRGLVNTNWSRVVYAPDFTLTID